VEAVGREDRRHPWAVEAGCMVVAEAEEAGDEVSSVAYRLSTRPAKEGFHASHDFRTKEFSLILI
jgi:hypothetical protein